MKKTFAVSIERVAHDGAGEGTHEGKAVRVMGMFPGEEGIIEAHTKKGLWVGTLREMTKASPSRKTPEELHYMTCGPWQTIAYPLQVALKQSVLDELYGYYPDAPRSSFHATTQFFGYRTKIEFSFADRDHVGNAIPLALAFHERGGGARRITLPDGCLLASREMNRAALAILEKLRSHGITARDLKSLVIRESKASGKLLAILFAKSERITTIATSDIAGLAGFLAFYSTEKSPASIPTKELWRIGEDVLDEIVLGVELRYPWDAFFQNNIPMFASAVEKIADATEDGMKVLELYAGVGTIGLALARRRNIRVHSIEIASGATDVARANARRNGIDRFVAECISAEKMDAGLFEGVDMLVLDPPRSGLHPNVLGMIAERPPRTVAYLSCNPETQARDYAQLADTYRIVSIDGFDFYPQTPHLESLLILEKR